MSVFVGEEGGRGRRRGRKGVGGGRGGGCGREQVEPIRTAFQHFSYNGQTSVVRCEWIGQAVCVFVRWGEGGVTGGQGWRGGGQALLQHLPVPQLQWPDQCCPI